MPLTITRDKINELIELACLELSRSKGDKIILLACSLTGHQHQFEAIYQRNGSYRIEIAGKPFYVSIRNP